MDIRFHETMAGHFTGKSNAPKHGLFEFTVDVFCPSVRDPRVLSGEITGTVTMEGVVDRSPLQGTIEISPLWNKTIAYAFTFTGPNGKPYRFAGHKSIEMMSFLKTMTFLPGEIRDDKNNLIATAETSFDAKADMVPFLLSFRMALGGAGKPAPSRM